MSGSKILNKTSKQGDPYEVIAQRVEDEVANAINELNMKGIGVLAQKGRFYPYHNSASHLAGFLGIRGDRRIGQYGIEGFYENDLKDGENVPQLLLSVENCHSKFSYLK